MLSFINIVAILRIQPLYEINSNINFVRFNDLESIKANAMTCIIELVHMVLVIFSHQLFTEYIFCGKCYLLPNIIFFGELYK